MSDASAPFKQSSFPLAGDYLALADGIAHSNRMPIANFSDNCNRQEQTEWCWAAVSQALLAATTHERKSQSEIARQVTGLSLPLSNVPKVIDFVFTKLGLQYQGPRGMVAHGQQFLTSNIASNIPVAITIAWNDDNGGHVIVACGWDSATEHICLFDPNSVQDSSDIVKWVPISEMTNYLEGSRHQMRGRWASGYAVGNGAG